MFNKWEKYSYADQKNHRTRLRFLFIKTAVVIVIYIVLTNFFFPMVVMESASMLPSIHPGERFVFSAFSVQRLLPQLPWGNVPYKRGSVIMVDRRDKEDESIISDVLDRLCRFFTAGHFGFPGKKNQSYIKRIIGLPGDEISMVNYVLKIHPADDPYTFTEYELSDKHYQVDIPQVAALWNDAIPFSGNLDTLVLKDDECFVLSDDRSNTNDSRTWGPVDITRITGTVLIRYWPLNKIGLP
ncbi:MAG: signal peptidase I [Spirochaetaceae bacterium]|jgi:signal peptidase I|nr:signal peptidase I [Spirochaetaceae bacterium]